MRTIRLVLAAAATVAVLVAPAAKPVDAQTSIAAFYYAWYGTPEIDGEWLHWNQGGHVPPDDVASSFVPARGPYSSSDSVVVRDQMAEMASASIDTVVLSWWGPGSIEDARLPLVLTEARRAGLQLAIHVEPYGDRTAPSVARDVRRLRRLGIRDFYVYDSTFVADGDWARSLRGLRGVRVFANTALVGKALAGGFHGIYTYDVLVNDGSSFRRVCTQAHAVGLACAPSVGPGFDGGRATPVTDQRSRNDGATYDRFWAAAIDAAPDVVTVTSYNEWHEGTQIEPARAATAGSGYEGAYGLAGADAETAYLVRTRLWAERLRTGQSIGVLVRSDGER